MIALHSFHPCNFLGKFTKSRIINSFKKKKINLLRKENMFSLVSLSKSKCSTHVAIVSFVSQPCHIRFVRVALLPHSCRTVLLVSYSCHACVACVVLVLLVSDTRVVKKTRSNIKRWHATSLCSSSKHIKNVKFSDLLLRKCVPVNI